MMKRNNKSSSIKIGRSALLIATLIGSSGLANASGSFGPGVSNSSQNSYNLGKRVYHAKLACDTCLLANDRLDKKGAMMVVDRLNSDKAVMNSLSEKERKAVTIYLKKRHKLN